jgi:hypothetical protein
MTSGGERRGGWRMGAVEALGPSEESPFIANIAPGNSQLAVDTNMFRWGAWQGQGPEAAAARAFTPVHAAPHCCL